MSMRIRWTWAYGGAGVLIGAMLVLMVAVALHLLPQSLWTPLALALWAVAVVWVCGCAVALWSIRP